MTWAGGRPAELVLRTARAGGDRRDEFTARLPLADPAARAAAAELLRPGGDGMARSPPRSRARACWSTPRTPYTSDHRGISVSGRLGVSLGFEHERVSGERRLVAASTVVSGGPPQRRFDCLERG